MEDLCHVQLAVTGGHCYLDLLMDCAFLERQPAYYAFKLKLKQSFGKRRPGNSCVTMLEKKLLNSSITATLKTAPSTGTREKSRLIKCVSIYISTFSAKYKIFLNILDIGDEIWMLLKFTVAFVLFS